MIKGSQAVMKSGCTELTGLPSDRGGGEELKATTRGEPAGVQVSERAKEASSESY